MLSELDISPLVRLEEQAKDLEPVLTRATALLERSVTLLSEMRQLLSEIRAHLKPPEETVYVDVEFSD